jgi:hypothetical protein
MVNACVQPEVQRRATPALLSQHELMRENTNPNYELISKFVLQFINQKLAQMDSA